MQQGVRRLLKGFLLLFLLLEGGLGFWTAFRGPQLAQHSRNQRLEGRVARGRISGIDGEPLAVSEWGSQGYTRKYVGPLSAIQTVGYVHQRFGKSGLELAYDDYLSGEASPSLSFWDQLLGARQGEAIVTTINTRIQQGAEAALGGQKGAVVVLDADSGAIWAAASVPYFDPQEMDESLLQGEKGNALFNRALQGRYPPGSAWKPLILTAALETRAVLPNEVFEDNGSIDVGGHQISNFGGEVFGTLNLQQALVHSSNVAFVQIGLRTSGSSITDLAERLGILHAPDLKVSTVASHLPSAQELQRDTVRAQVSIGQGEVWVTPLHMAVVAATIGNGGFAVSPFLVKKVGNRDVARQGRGPRVIPSWIADYVGNAMRAVVAEGTGRLAEVSGVQVAGKTGTAQNPGGPAHAWFISFVPRDGERPPFAVAVVLENAGGTGGTKAAPVAAKVIKAALNSFQTDGGKQVSSR